MTAAGFMTLLSFALGAVVFAPLALAQAPRESALLGIDDRHGAVDHSEPDDTLPVAVCRDTTVSLDFFGDAAITPGLVDGGSHDAEGPVILSITPSAFTCADVGPNPVTLEVVDSAGQVAICEATVTVVDDTPPLGLYGTEYFHLPATGTLTITPDQVVGGEFDACGIVSKTLSRVAFGCEDVHPRCETGEVLIEVTLADANGNVTVSPATIGLYFEPGPMTAAPATQTVSYSDRILPVVIEANEDPCRAIQFHVEGLSGGLGTESAGPGTWILSGQMLEPDGTSVLVAHGTLIDAEVGTRIEIDVEPEAAGLTFDPGNPAAIRIAEPGGTSAFTLAVDVAELDIPNNGSGDSDLAGDISRARVSMTLVRAEDGLSIAGACTPQTPVPGLVDPESPFDYDRMTVVCAFDEVPAGTYLAEATVSGGYFRGSATSVLTVFEPGVNAFATGGGYFYWPGTATETYPGDKTTFAFNAQIETSGPNAGSAKGSLRVLRHLREGGILGLRSTTMEGLIVGAGTDGPFTHAFFTGKAVIRGSGDRRAPGDEYFIVYVEDRGQPGAGGDRFWLTTENGRMSLPAPPAVNARTISGGNIVLPNPRGASPPSNPEVSFPAAIALLQNAPNPFTGATRIGFHLAEDAHVRLSVFDVRGREVARLLDRPLTAGRHTALLEATSLPAGIYFYRIHAGPFTETRRMMLLH